MEGFIYIIVFVCAILNIILFFKVWRMTNDVHALREKYAPENKEKEKFDGVPTTWEEVDKTTHVTEQRRYIREQYASDNKQEFINN